MEAHQQRVMEERSELAARLLKLGAFIGGAIFAALPPEERERLDRQYQHMQDYYDVLNERIAAF